MGAALSQSIRLIRPCSTDNDNGTNVDNKIDLYQRLRPKLFGLAYRLLGSRVDAEDLLQDAWFKWSEADSATIRDAEAWLITVVTRLGIDQLRQRRARQEDYYGPWLPEPLLGFTDNRAEQIIDLRADLSMAFMVALERLAAEERAALLLREVFDCSYEEIAEVLGKSPAASRQIVSRARKRIREAQPRFVVDYQAHRQLVERFAEALLSPGGDAFVNLLAEEVNWTADGGGQAVAASKIVHGARAAMRLANGIARRAAGQWHASVEPINGEPGIVVRSGEHIHAAMTLVSDGQRIVQIYSIVNPHKLGQGSREPAQEVPA
jgi:RNA polymerase sigma-70 factor (ECF subfamily)